MSAGPNPTRHRADGLKEVRLGWYALAAVPILLLFAGSLSGTISPLFLLPALFGVFFLLFSLLFVLYGRRKSRKSPAPK